MRAGSHALAASWVVLVGVCALGHATALRNALVIVVPLATLVAYADDRRPFPCRAIALALLVVAGASIAWSPVPAVSFSKWRSDLAMPLLAGAGAFAFARARGDRTFALGLSLGLAALCAMSAFGYLPTGWVGGLWRVEPMAGIVRPLPRWYPGPGDASMYAILAIAPLFVATRDALRWRLAGIAAIAFVVVTTNNRNALLLAPAVLVVLVWLDRRGAARPIARASLRRATTVAAVALAVVVALGGVLEIGARERLRTLNRVPAGDSAALELAVADTRPAIWRYYFERGLDAPWLGSGFGRTVPGIGFETERDRALAAVEPNAYVHAHNLVLNWWLQLGAVGVLLLFAAALAIRRASVRLADDADDLARARSLRQAVAVTLAATLARNLSDDFMVFGMAVTFCVVIGALLGELAAISRRSP